MWIYKQISDYEYWVGYFEQFARDNGGTDDEFQKVETHVTKEDARKAVNYLNGGSVIAPNPLP